ncbi:MAG: cyclic nucleotide-binding domain-containing protein [Acidimicrobiia bacterium]|nr:cyclic nucleotide-binding domain-containing protein [Acidimicrobiia bacterium]
MAELHPLDAFIAPELRTAIERRYYAKVNKSSTLAEALKDPTFLAAPADHVALFADHGVIHARDVAHEIQRVLEAVHGVLIPERTTERFGWMKAFGAVVGLIHDVGMVDLSQFGRFMHPERATQTVLAPEFDDVFASLWADDRGGLTSRLSDLHESNGLQTAPQTVLREMLAMAVCHSKTKVAISVLNDRDDLREVLQTAATTDLRCLYLQQQAARAASAVERAHLDGLDATEAKERLRKVEAALGSISPAERLSRFAHRQTSAGYADFAAEGFSWVVSDDPEVEALVDDVVDTLRALRAADALRQRGTVLKTSGNYEVFVDQRSANAIYALRLDEGHLYLLEVPDRISAGEANVASSELDQEGNLRISFHRGRFSDQETVLYAAECAALIVNDIQGDAIESFRRPAGDNGLRQSCNVEILLESADDNPAFADLVRQALTELNPTAGAQARVVPSLQSKSAFERAHYLNGEVLSWDRDHCLSVLAEVARFGHRTDDIDPAAAFPHVRRLHLQADEYLIHAGAPAGFVYIAEGEGLRGIPLGGYGEFHIRPWIPVGVTGVIRGSIRNADIVADQDVTVLAIPRDVYVEFWHRTYDQSAFADHFSD